MKKIFLVIAIIAIVSFSYATSPERFERTFHWLAQTTETLYQAFLYEREYRFVGTERVSEVALAKRLPSGSSTLWWHLGTDEFAHYLKQDPFVKDAKIESCGFFSWRCFEIKVEEREPAFLTQFGKRQWIVARDGGFLSPASDSDKASLPFVEGVLTSSSSPELVHSRLSYVAKAIGVIQGELGFPLQTLTITEGAELKATFRNLPFSVVFDGDEGELYQLSSEAKRLNALIGRLDMSRQSIERIDLAYKRLAVVKLREDEQAQQ